MSLETNTDGVINTAEWATAGQLTFTAYVATNTPRTVTLYVMNDADNIYFGLSFPWDSAGSSNQFSVLFSNDNSGVSQGGDDQISVYAGDLGSTDGGGVFNVSGGNTIYEMWHPLNSGDVHDISLVPGGEVGFSLYMRICQASCVGNFYPPYGPSYTFGTIETDAGPTPEPASFLLIGLALPVLAAIRRRRATPKG